MALLCEEVSAKIFFRNTQCLNFQMVAIQNFHSFISIMIIRINYTYKLFCCFIFYIQFLFIEKNINIISIFLNISKYK